MRSLLYPQFVSIAVNDSSSLCRSSQSLHKLYALYTKGISNNYSQQYIDHDLFKQALLNNDKVNKIKFNIISVKKQQICTKEIEKKNIEFLNDKRYIENVYSNKPHTLHIE